MGSQRVDDLCRTENGVTSCSPLTPLSIGPGEKRLRRLKFKPDIEERLRCACREGAEALCDALGNVFVQYQTANLLIVIDRNNDEVVWSLQDVAGVSFR